MTKTVTLGEICDINSGGTPSRTKPEFYGGEIPWAKISDIENAKDGLLIQTEERITNAGLASINNRIFEKGTLLLAIYGSVGKVAITGVRTSTNQAILGIRPKVGKSIDIQYLKHWFALVKKRLLDRAVGAALQNISLAIVKELEIPLPPLSEQRRIATLLDRADALRQKDRQLLAHYDQLAQSIFLDLFGDDKKKLSNWKEVKIEELANGKGGMRTGPFGSDLLHSEFVEEGVFVLGIDNVVNNRFEWAKPRYITEEKYKKLKRYTVYPGDVLISIMGTTGRTAVVPNNIPDAINSKHLAAITLNKKVANPTFVSLSLLFDRSVKHQIASQNKGAIMDGLNLGIIKALRLKLPDLSLQTHFAGLIEQIERQKAVVRQQMAASEALFGRLLQECFPT